MLEGVAHIIVHMHTSALIWQQFGVLEREAMSLLEVGRVMLGETDGIISYLRARRLLGRNQTCAR